MYSDFGELRNCMQLAIEHNPWLLVGWQLTKDGDVGEVEMNSTLPFSFAQAFGTVKLRWDLGRT